MSDEQDTQAEAPPKRGRPSNEDVYQKGYDAGFEAGIQQAAFGRQTLFDRCKEFAAANWKLPDEVLRGRFAEMSDEHYLGHRLSRADTELVLGIARRKRTSANAEREAIKSLVRPKSRREHVDSGDVVLS